jgi:hypothetical protein
LLRATVAGNLARNFRCLFERSLSSGGSKTCRRGAGLDARGSAASTATGTGSRVAVAASTRSQGGARTPDDEHERPSDPSVWLGAARGKHVPSPYGSELRSFRLPVTVGIYL